MKEKISVYDCKSPAILSVLIIFIVTHCDNKHASKESYWLVFYKILEAKAYILDRL